MTDDGGQLTAMRSYEIHPNAGLAIRWVDSELNTFSHSSDDKISRSTTAHPIAENVIG